jgi:hypothetical protein
MFEVIDPSVTVTGRPISQWIGDVTRQNVIELAERGAGGGYVWSVQPRRLFRRTLTTGTAYPS